MGKENSIKSNGILLVEDDLLLANVEKRIIHKMGYEVAGEASSGEEAIEKARTLAPAVIMMDISLDGDMDGFEAIRRIREKIDVPVIYTSGSSEEEARVRAFEDDELGFLTKPLSYEKLESMLEEVIPSGGVAAE